MEITDLLIAMVFLFFAVSFLFSGAKITVSPKTVDLTLNDSFSASKDSANIGSLPFDLVVFRCIPLFFPRL
jgi:hypothetical protein